jgi:hypothetical protein
MTRHEHLLTLVSEEAAELVQRATKALRFGMGEVQPGQDHSNDYRLCEEWTDLVAVMEMLGLESFGREAIAAKVAKVERFLAYSRDVGTLR